MREADYQDVQNLTLLRSALHLLGETILRSERQQKRLVVARAEIYALKIELEKSIEDLQ